MITCDRCGKMISGEKSRSVLNSTKNEPCVIIKASYKAGFFAPWQDVELCQECKDDFVKWIKKGKEKENAELD